MRCEAVVIDNLCHAVVLAGCKRIRHAILSITCTIARRCTTRTERVEDEKIGYSGGEATCGTGRKYKLLKHCTTQCVRYIFTERVADVRNSLPNTVDFNSLAVFKRTIKCVNFSCHLRFSCR